MLLHNNAEPKTLSGTIGKSSMSSFSLSDKLARFNPCGFPALFPSLTCKAMDTETKVGDGGDLIEHRWIVSLYTIPTKLHLLRRQQRKDVKCSGVNRYGPVGPLCQR